MRNDALKALMEEVSEDLHLKEVTEMHLLLKK